ncbi:ultraviolet-B receptor UVR8 isoform X2 [Cryptomeria japonica]|uniref:ultraviolet-B receptor UVR8 isoform X2 n=1 Tax=Cryptomeria japonica TaxID=3369 RepID=UPI0027DA9697|nr:ultraviolet-B receptor UVR8 isoform X2 [Cryptomeria japonica]
MQYYRLRHQYHSIQLLTVKKMEEEKKEEEKREVWIRSWGAGTDGQLGTGKEQDEWLPQFVPSLATLAISSISCGGAHALALLRGGGVVSWGRGKSGQLGHGDSESIIKPKLIKSLENIVICCMSAGWSHSAFVSECGQLFTCGDGTFGQLGLGHFDSQHFPCKVLAFETKHVSMVSCGMRHTLVLAKGISDSSVFAFGSARHGQLGAAASCQNLNGPNSSRKEARCINIPVRVKDLDIQNVVFICANGDHSSALTENGHLYVWGKGFDGNSDISVPMLATTTLRFCQVALGWNHGMVLTDDGKAYMWGGSHHGKLSMKKENMMKADSNVLGQVGDSLAFQRISLLGETKIKQIAAGAEHSAIILENEVVMTWGWGEHGQLGLGSTCDYQCPQTVSISIPSRDDQNNHAVYCGSGFTFALRF